jgi:hypothetical protein
MFRDCARCAPRRENRRDRTELDADRALGAFGRGAPVRDAPGRQAATAATSPNMSKTCRADGHREMTRSKPCGRKIRNGHRALCRLLARWLGLCAGPAAGICRCALPDPDRVQCLSTRARLGRNAALAPLPRSRSGPPGRCRHSRCSGTDCRSCRRGCCARPGRQAQHEIARGNQHARRAIAALQRVLAVKAARSSVAISSLSRPSMVVTRAPSQATA